jgi:lysophospholipase L1-like esterase
VGQNSATARRIRHQLLPQLEKNLDVAVLLAGVNDVLARRTPQDWNDDLTAIAGELGARARQTVVAGIPPFDAFPALPKTLGRYLAGRAAAFDEVSRRVCADHASSVWLDARTLLPAGVEFFSRDRFHPSAFGYRRWAGAVADLVES